MHSGRKRIFAASPQIRKQRATNMIFRFLFTASRLKKGKVVSIMQDGTMYEESPPQTNKHKKKYHLVHATRLPKYLHHFMQLSRTLQKTSVTAISSIFCKTNSPIQCLVHIYRENLLKMNTEGHGKDSICGDCLSFYQKHVTQHQLQAVVSIMLMYLK